MTTIKAIVNTTVRILGCPRPGWDGATALDALDFRREHNLPEDRADADIVLHGEITDEDAIRSLVKAGCGMTYHSDGTAVMHLRTGSSSDFPVASPAGHIKHGSAYGWLAEVPVGLLQRARSSYSQGELTAILLAVCSDTPARQQARLEVDKRLAALRDRVAALSQEMATCRDEILAIRRGGSAEV